MSVDAAAKMAFSSVIVMATIPPDAFRPNTVDAASVNATGVLSDVAYNTVFASNKDFATAALAVLLAVVAVDAALAATADTAARSASASSNAEAITSSPVD